MIPRTCRWLASALLMTSTAVVTADDISSSERGRRALSVPMPALSEAQMEQFADGRSLFNQMWVIAPSDDDDIDGLGPLYNSLSCLACHPGNGRGHAPDGPGEPMRSMLVRLSVTGEHDASPRPHPVYGAQLQELAIPGVAPEGRAEVQYHEFELELVDGSRVSMRKPDIVLRDPGYGDFGHTLLSGRIGPALVGMGLLDAVSDAEILQWADPEDEDGNGISGRPHWVVDEAEQRRVGRFGYKAALVTLRDQIASAFHEDLGLTSSLAPTESCTVVQTACLNAPSGGSPEIDDVQLDVVEAYMQWLAIPKPDVSADPELVERGRILFMDARCHECHRPQMRTAADAEPALLAHRLINPYSDLLLHDMGPELSDQRPDGDASGSEWRTAPLWGIGLADSVADRVGYLHDGRARTLLEAILWHGGESEASRQRFMELSSGDREALLAFLRSL